jgi:hypothetical protein
MQDVPGQVKKENLVLFLKPAQRIALALTSKKESQWVSPILVFMRMPIAAKIAFLKGSSHTGIPDGVIMEALGKHHDPVAIVSLLTAMPDGALKDKVRGLVEDRIRDRSYRKLIKKTLLQIYLEYMIQNNKRVGRFFGTIQSPDVLSQAIEQYILLQKGKLTDRTLRGWAERIPDEITRNRVLRRL